MRIEYIIGTRYGKANVELLEVLVLENKKVKKGRFRCDCNNEFVARISEIIAGVTTGCGCRRNHNKIHGLSEHPMYNTWEQVKKRCYCTTNKLYPYYGGRGITMSDEFRDDAKAFIDYIVSLPNYDKRIEGIYDYSLDRIENNEGYKRGNLRWATRSEQMLNRRSYIRK